MLVPEVRNVAGREMGKKWRFVHGVESGSHPPPLLPSGTVISHRSAAASFPAFLWFDARTPSRSSAKARGFALPELERMATTFPRMSGMAFLGYFSARRTCRTVEDGDVSVAFRADAYRRGG